MERQLLERQLLERLYDVGVRETPLLFSRSLSDDLNSHVYLKMESEQTTGSFKLRGASNKIAKLEDLPQKVITSSTGNHGLGVAYAAKRLGIEAEVWLRACTSQQRKERIEAAGASLVLIDSENSAKVELMARREAKPPFSIYVPPYNDPDTIEGQSSVGLEILTQLDQPADFVFVNVGGGGLISGVATSIKKVWPRCQVIGVQPENDAQLYHSIQAGRMLEDYPCKATLSTGSAGANELDTITFPICQQFVDRWILVKEEEIRNGIWEMLTRHNKIVEGAAACALAGLLKMNREELKNKTSVVVICGSNISLDIIKDILNEHC